jgi:hypothetical protein
MSYELRCHCGAVQGEVDGDLPTEALICNCSHCSAKGLALSAISREQLRLTAGEESLRTYQFNSKAIHHRFCGECGTQPFAEGQGPDGSAMAMVNLRCVPAVDLESLNKVPFDGASR